MMLRSTADTVEELNQTSEWFWQIGKLHWVKRGAAEWPVRGSICS